MASVVNWGIELLLAVTVDWMPEWLGLTVLSVLMGAGILWVIGKLTPQRALEVARDRMASGIYEMRVFIDDPVRIIEAQFRFLNWGVRYTAMSLIPLLVIAAPLTLVFLHLEARYGFEPFRVGQGVVMEIGLGAGGSGDVEIEAPTGVNVASSVFLDEKHGVAHVQVEGTAAGEKVLKVRRAGQAEWIEKSITFGTDASILSMERGGWWARGAESPLPSGVGVTQVRVPYPERPQNWLWLGMPWWLYSMLVATIAALALRRPMGVVI